MASKRKAAMASTELVPAGNDSSYLALRMQPDELRDLIQTNIGGGDIDVNMLDRVKMPSGGATVWEVPTVDGEESVKTVEGVIIHMGTARRYWKAAYGEGEQGAPPDCQSNDGFTGVGNPGGECAGCPLNQFGTGKNGRSKACTEIRQVFILPEDSIIPIVINLTPGSLRAMSQYTMRLLRTGVRITDCVTTLALEKVDNKDGVKFARVAPTRGAMLAPEAKERINALATALAPVFDKALTTITQADVEGTAEDA